MVDSHGLHLTERDALSQDSMDNSIYNRFRFEEFIADQPGGCLKLALLGKCCELKVWDIRTHCCIHGSKSNSGRP